jgi:hypothetical protein
MKIVMTSVLIPLLVAAGSAQAQLLLQYQFNSADTATTNALDSSGNNLSGSFQKQGIVGGAALQTGAGVSGLAGDYAYNGAAANGMGTNGTNAGRVKYGGGGFNSSYSSLTVCGWFKTESGSLTNSARLLVAVGTENLMLFDSVGNGLRFQIGASFVDSGANTYTNASTWTFFAVTYDSTLSTNNVSFWLGDTSNLSLVASKTMTGAGVWDGLGATADFSIGNRQGTTAPNNMDRPFDGYIDDFRIYGVATGSSGALSQTQLSAIRASAVRRSLGLYIIQ